MRNKVDSPSWFALLAGFLFGAVFCLVAAVVAVGGVAAWFVKQPLIWAGVCK